MKQLFKTVLFLGLFVALFSVVCLRLERSLDAKVRVGDCMKDMNKNMIFVKIIKIEGMTYTIASVKDGKEVVSEINLPVHSQHNYKKVNCY